MAPEAEMLSMRRRKLLQALGTAGATGLAGCSSILGSSDDDDRRDWKTPTATPEPEAAQETFEYYFDSVEGLGNVNNEEIPEDAARFQVIDEGPEKTWEEIRSNDLDGDGGAYDAMAYDEGPNAEGWEGSLDAIIQRTEEIFNNPVETFSTEGSYRVENIENESDAVVFTRSLVKAVEEETEIASSGGKDTIINSIAEPVLNQLDIEIPGYSLSTLMATEECGPDYCNWAEGQLPRDVLPQEGEDAEQIKVNSGFHHQPGLLQYENQNGEQEVEYVEPIGPSGTFRNWVRKPEESVYTLPLSKEPDLSEGEVFPEHFVTALEYTKARELEEMGGVDLARPDWAIGVTLYHMVDDIENDIGPTGDDVHSYGRTAGWDIIVEDSLGESLEDFKKNPTKQKAEYFRNTARGMKLALDKQGYDEPLRLSGTLEDPTYEHLARDEFEQIIDQRQQRISS